MRLPHFQKHSVSLYQTVSHRYGILLVNVESEENNLDGSNYRCGNATDISTDYAAMRLQNFSLVRNNCCSS